MVGYKVPAVVRTQLSSLATGLPTLKCSWYGITWSNIWLTHCSKKSESVIMEMFYIFTWYTCLKQNHSLWCHLTMFIFFPHTFFFTPRNSYTIWNAILCHFICHVRTVVSKMQRTRNVQLYEISMIIEMIFMNAHDIKLCRACCKYSDCWFALWWSPLTWEN